MNEILPGGATETGMIPSGISADIRSRLLKPEIIVPVAVFLHPMKDGESRAGASPQRNGRSIKPMAYLPRKASVHSEQHDHFTKISLPATQPV